MKQPNEDDFESLLFLFHEIAHDLDKHSKGMARAKAKNKPYKIKHPYGAPVQVIILPNGETKFGWTNGGVHVVAQCEQCKAGLAHNH